MRSHIIIPAYNRSLPINEGIQMPSSRWVWRAQDIAIVQILQSPAESERKAAPTIRPGGLVHQHRWRGWRTFQGLVDGHGATEPPLHKQSENLTIKLWSGFILPKSFRVFSIFLQDSSSSKASHCWVLPGVFVLRWPQQLLVFASPTFRPFPLVTKSVNKTGLHFFTEVMKIIHKGKAVLQFWAKKTVIVGPVGPHLPLPNEFDSVPQIWARDPSLPLQGFDYTACASNPESINVKKRRHGHLVLPKHQETTRWAKLAL